MLSLRPASLKDGACPYREFYGFFSSWTFPLAMTVEVSGRLTAALLLRTLFSLIQSRLTWLFLSLALCDQHRRYCSDWLWPWAWRANPSVEARAVSTTDPYFAWSPRSTNKHLGRDLWQPGISQTTSDFSSCVQSLFQCFWRMQRRRLS